MNTYLERAAVSSSQKSGVSRNGELSAYLDKELARFGNNLWRGKPFEVAEDTILAPGQEGDVVLNVYPKNLPFNGNIFCLVYDLLGEHVRSRYAHGLSNVKNLGKTIGDGLLRSPRSPRTDAQIQIKSKMINHGSTPLGFHAGDEPVYLMYVPKEAEVIGEELDNLIDNRIVGVKGRQGIDWSRDRRGGTPTKGMFVAIHKEPHQRFWIPPSDKVLYIPSGGSFENVRAWMFDPVNGVFKRANDPDYPMPKGHIFVARLPFLTLPDNMCAVLDPVAYIGDLRNPDAFEEVGFQSNSLVLDSRANEVHNVEMKETNGEKAEYARVRIVRSAGDIAG